MRAAENDTVRIITGLAAARFGYARATLGEQQSVGAPTSEVLSNPFSSSGAWLGEMPVVIRIYEQRVYWHKEEALSWWQHTYAARLTVEERQNGTGVKLDTTTECIAWIGGHNRPAVANRVGKIVRRGALAIAQGRQEASIE